MAATSRSCCCASKVVALSHCAELVNAYQAPDADRVHSGESPFMQHTGRLPPCIRVSDSSHFRVFLPPPDSPKSLSSFLLLHRFFDVPALSRKTLVVYDIPRTQTPSRTHKDHNAHFSSKHNMPSQTFQLARTEALESLPDYTPLPQDASQRRLSTILEMDEEDAEAGVAKPRFWTSWELKSLLVAEYATMIPQALLVDASSTLCVYLYFVSRHLVYGRKEYQLTALYTADIPSSPSGSSAQGVSRCPL